MGRNGNDHFQRIFILEDVLKFPKFWATILKRLLLHFDRDVDLEVSDSFGFIHDALIYSDPPKYINSYTSCHKSNIHVFYLMPQLF